MKILQITNELGYRGTPRFLLNCASIAQNAGHSILVWGLDEGGYAADSCIEKNIPVLVGENRLPEAIAFSPDIVHIHRGGGHSSRDVRILRALKSATGCRVLETNVFGIFDPSPNLPIDLHSHISGWDLWRWRLWQRPFRQPGILLPYCIDTESFIPVPSDFRTAHGIPANAFLVGRLGKTDWSLLAPIMENVMSASPDIWFATVDDYSAEGLAAFPLHLRSRIVSVPRLAGANALSAFYSDCSITVNFSPIGESFGYGIAESMACGTPVLVHSKPRNDNAQIELAAPEYGGFPVKDANNAAECILELAANRSLLADAAAKCRDSIRRRYSVESFSPKLLETYRLLAPRRLAGCKLERLFAENGFTVDLPGAEIARQLSNVRGGPPSRAEYAKIALAFSLPNALRQYLLGVLS